MLDVHVGMPAPRWPTTLTHLTARLTATGPTLEMVYRGEVDVELEKSIGRSIASLPHLQSFAFSRHSFFWLSAHLVEPLAELPLLTALVLQNEGVPVPVMDVVRPMRHLRKSECDEFTVEHLQRLVDGGCTDTTARVAAVLLTADDQRELRTSS
jgi:hypothetical protein